MKVILPIALLLCGSTAFASPRQKLVIANQSAVILPAGFVAIPFAVPVAVPSYYQYQYLPQYQAPAAPPAAEPAAQATNAPIQAHEAPPPTLVQRTCVKCHSGPEPKGKLDLSGELSPEQRLKAIGRLLADDLAKRMPKGKEIDAEMRGKLIQELAKPKP